MANKVLNSQDGMSMLMSLLMILVDRAGGSLVIDKLKDYQTRQFDVQVEIDPAHDKAIIRTKEKGGMGINARGSETKKS